MKQGFRGNVAHHLQDERGGPNHVQNLVSAWTLALTVMALGVPIDAVADDFSLITVVPSRMAPAVDVKKCTRHL